MTARPYIIYQCIRFRTGYLHKYAKMSLSSAPSSIPNFLHTYSPLPSPLIISPCFPLSFSFPLFPFFLFGLRLSIPPRARAAAAARSGRWEGGRRRQVWPAGARGESIRRRQHHIRAALLTHSFTRTNILPPPALPLNLPAPPHSGRRLWGNGPSDPFPQGSGGARRQGGHPPPRPCSRPVTHVTPAPPISGVTSPELSWEVIPRSYSSISRLQVGDAGENDS